MEKVTVLKALTGYFNAKDAPNFVPLRQWRDQIAALTPEEKRELAEGVVAITGEELVAAV